MECVGLILTKVSSHPPASEITKDCIHCGIAMRGAYQTAPRSARGTDSSQVRYSQVTSLPASACNLPLHQKRLGQPFYAYGYRSTGTGLRTRTHVASPASPSPVGGPKPPDDDAPPSASLELGVIYKRFLAVCFGVVCGMCSCTCCRRLQCCVGMLHSA